MSMPSNDALSQMVVLTAYSLRLVGWELPKQSENWRSTCRKQEARSEESEDLVRVLANLRRKSEIRGEATSLVDWEPPKWWW
jgi:hypothetical protein